MQAMKSTLYLPVAVVLLARLVRRAWQRRRGLVRIGYPDGRFVEVVPGTSVLEASRLAGIPHAHVCGGRGRCSTCRVRVISDRSALPQPSGREAFVLDRIGVAANPSIRLACQLRPQTDVAVIPLLPPSGRSYRLAFRRSSAMPVAARTELSV